MFLIILLYALFASTFSLGKALLGYTSPVFLVGVRMTIAGSILLVFQYFYAHHTFHFKREHIKYYIQGILFTVYIPYILRFWALEELSAAKASLLYNLGPFISYILGYFLAKEKVTWAKTLGLIIGFCGFLPTLIEREPLESLVGNTGFLSWAEISCMLSISALSYGWIVMHKLVRTKKYPPAMINGLNMFCGGILALMTAPFTETIFISDFKKFSMIIAVIILVSNLICHNLYTTLLKHHSPTMLSFAGFLTPLFTALYGWVLFGETVPMSFFLSVVLVFIGLGIFYSDELKTKEEVVPI
jgi:drug/metabolite transporter (DMT)-like permease